MPEQDPPVTATNDSPEALTAAAKLVADAYASGEATANAAREAAEKVAAAAAAHAAALLDATERSVARSLAFKDTIATLQTEDPESDAIAKAVAAETAATNEDARTFAAIADRMTPARPAAGRWTAARIAATFTVKALRAEAKQLGLTSTGTEITVAERLAAAGWVPSPAFIATAKTPSQSGNRH